MSGIKNWITAIIAGVVVCFVLSARTPEFMRHWDEFQLSYGVDDFDLTRHQPHPPGYYLFVLAGRVLEPITGDASTALQLVSILCIGLTVAVLVSMVVSRLKIPSGLALAGACIAFSLLSPSVLNYGSVGLTYAAEGTTFVLVCLALGNRPARRGLLLLALSIGLIGGLRQNLTIWGFLLLVLEMLRHRDWIPLKRAPIVFLMIVLGSASWIIPLLIESGGFEAWQNASSALLKGDIWESSIFFTGTQGLSRRLDMLHDLWRGLGPFLLVMPFLLFARVKGQLKSLDPLVVGGLVAIIFYALFIYNTDGYVVTPVLAWGAWVLLGLAELLAKRSAKQQGVLGIVLIVVAAFFPIIPGMADPDGESPYTANERHDALMKDRFDAVHRAVEKGQISPQNTVLVTSVGYWFFSFRHVAHYLPEFTTVQLTIDPYIEITKPSSPYLVSHERHLTTVGPDGLPLSYLLPGRRLKYVLYMIPYDFRDFIHPACARYSSMLVTANKTRLVWINARDGMVPRIVQQKLICDTSNAM